MNAGFCSRYTVSICPLFPQRSAIAERAGVAVVDEKFSAGSSSVASYRRCFPM